MQIRFTIYGRPVPASRPRVKIIRNKYTGKKINLTSYTKPYMRWKEQAGIYINQAKSRYADLFKVIPYRDQPFYMMAKFYFKPRKKDEALTWVVSRPDVDNLCKAVMDAMNENFFSDDAQISWADCRKMYHGWRDGSQERIEISLTPLELAAL